MQRLPTINPDLEYPEYSFSVRYDFIGKKDEYGVLSAYGWEAVYGNAVALAEHISNGYAIAVASYVGGHRHGEKVIDCCLIGLDFDGKEGKYPLSAEQAAAHPFISRHAAVVSPTASDSRTLPRTRALIPLDRSVNAEEQARLESIFKHVLAEYVDPSTFDQARFFYGSQPSKERVFVAPYNVLRVDEFLAEYKELADTATLPSEKGKRKGGGGVALTGDIEDEVNDIIEAAGDSLLDFEPESYSGKYADVLDKLQYVSRLWFDGRKKSYDLWYHMWASAHRASDGADEVLQYIHDCKLFWAENEGEQSALEKSWDSLGERDEAITAATLSWLARLVGWGRHNRYGELTTADLKLDVIELADAFEQIKRAVKPGSNVAIKSQTGSGKTKLNVELMRYLGIEPSKAAVISPFTYLNYAGARGMSTGGIGAICYEVKGADESGAVVWRTPQSAIKRLPYPSKLSYVFIEEVHALLKHLTTLKSKPEYGHMSDDDRGGFLRWLNRALRCPTCTVIMVDAGITDVDVEYLREIAPLTVIHNVGRRPKSSVRRVSEETAFECARETLERGEQVVINVTTAGGCTAWYEALARYSASSVLLIKDTSAERDAKAFAADVEAGAANTQLVIYNAKLGTGVSIEKTRPALFIQVADYLTPTVWIQHLNRYRRGAAETLFVLDLKQPRISRKTYEDFKQEALDKWRAEAQALGLGRGNRDKDADAIAFDKLRTKRQAAERAEQVDALLYYRAVLNEDGRDFVDEVDEDLDHPYLAKAREIIAERRAEVMREYPDVPPIDPRERIETDMSIETYAKGTLHHRLKQLGNGYLPSDREPQDVAATLLNHAGTISDLEGSMRDGEHSERQYALTYSPSRGYTDIGSHAAKRTLVQMSRTLITGLKDEITPEILEREGVTYVRQIRGVKKMYNGVVGRQRNSFEAIEARCAGDKEKMAVMLLKHVLASLGLNLVSERSRPRNEVGKQVSVYTYKIANADEAIDAMLWRERGRMRDENIEHIRCTFGITRSDAFIVGGLFEMAGDAAALDRFNAEMKRTNDPIRAIEAALPHWRDPSRWL